MNKSLVSIIIAAKNAEATLGKCLDNVFRLRYPDIEVIVVDDGSVDGTGDIARSYPKVQVLRTDGVGPSKARNLAVVVARGAFIAFTDADCLVATDWLGELTKGFVSDSVAGVGGVQRSPEDEQPFGRKVNLFLSFYGFLTNYMQRSLSIKEVPHNASCNVMYRKAVYERLGGLWEGFWPGEDLDFDHRLRKRGYKLMMVPGAVVYHYRPRTLAGFRNMMFRYGWAQGKLVREYGVFRFVQWVPLVVLAAAVLIIWGVVIYPVQTFLSVLILLGAGWGWLRFDGLLFQLTWIAFFSWHKGFLKGLVGR